uniref:SPOR domain-containing protein n=1 Tax=Rhodothermus marinus TaxID=29549 RepID=A0A7V2AYY9_RHOMR
MTSCRLYALSLGLMFLVGCATLRPKTEPRGPQPTEEALALADYEEFEPSAYADPPPPTPQVVHDVPEALWLGQLGAAEPRVVVEGYRVQIALTENKAEADRLYEEVLTWWRQMVAEGRLADIAGTAADPPPIYIVYKAPYYRIRLGNFRNRAEAQRLLRLAAQRFEGAFITADQVILRP